jgi:hypothetical protein
MKFSLRNTLWFLILTLLLATACEKKACKDKDATNYDEKAEKEDNSTCLYKGKIVVWFTKSYSEKLLNDGTSYLIFKLDNDTAGTLPADEYWVNRPDCDIENALTIERDLGHSKSKTFTFSVYNDTAFNLSKGFVNFKGNKCESVEVK